MIYNNLIFTLVSRLTIVSREAKKKQAVRDEQVIKTHDSESRGQEEAGRTRRTSELFTRSTALKFVNALNKPP